MVLFGNSYRKFEPKYRGMESKKSLVWIMHVKYTKF
jgi:hypothetical protein